MACMYVCMYVCDRKSPHPLAIQPKVFGKRLREKQRVAFVEKEPDGKGVGLGIARGEALIG